VDDARALGAIARERGATVRVQVDAGTGHDERSWAARLPRSLGFLFG
jgi:hypothetical protein